MVVGGTTAGAAAVTAAHVAAARVVVCTLPAADAEEGVEKEADCDKVCWLACAAGPNVGGAERWVADESNLWDTALKQPSEENTAAGREAPNTTPQPAESIERGGIMPTKLWTTNTDTRANMKRTSTIRSLPK